MFQLVSNKAFGQDTSKVSQSQKWTIFRAYVGVMPGFNMITKDSANVTLAIPIGLSMRNYFNNGNSNLDFFDIDLSEMPIVLNQSSYTSFLKLTFGVGFSGDNTNSQAHISYLHNFVGFSDMIGFGYDLETISLPISIDYFKPLKTRNQYILVGFKIPFRLN